MYKLQLEKASVEMIADKLSPDFIKLLSLDLDVEFPNEIRIIDGF